MALRSDLFKGDRLLQACQDSHAGNIWEGAGPRAVGDHVTKIQEALRRLDNASIDPAELTGKRYGKSTAAAVLRYKENPKRNVINPSYQSKADNIVGIMTITRMDDELFGAAASHTEAIDRAFDDSRRSLGVVQGILRQLARDIDAVIAASEPQKTTLLAALLQTHRRNILVISRRLLVSADPLSPGFRDALSKVQDLVRRNLAETKTITDQGALGRCSATAHGGKVPFAATQRTDPNPRVSVCDPFFNSSRDLQRDVITHEYFHLLGLKDRSVNNTSEAFDNANTIAQVVALLHDRFRQRNSDGNEPAVPPLPSP